MKRVMTGITVACLWPILAGFCANPSFSQEQPSQTQPGSTTDQSQPSPQPTTPPSQDQSAPPPQVPAQNPPSENSNVPAEKKTRKKSGTARTGLSKSSSTAKKNTAKKTPSGNQSGKVVVRNGGAKDASVQLAPGMTKEQQQHSRENTEQLLATTDTNLKTLAGHQLSPAQQSMVDQIHAYVRQSKEAAGSGDLARAHTLAYKAHLLSDEVAAKQ